MGKLQQGVNDLYTWCLNNGEFGQQLLQEWTGLEENNQPISIYSVARASGKKVKWRCSKGHVWIVGISNRTANNTGCPYCCGRVVTNENRLTTWCLNNGALGKQIVREWVGLDKNNQPVSMDSIPYGSDKEVQWRCSNGHEWIARLNSRTVNRSGCPYCYKKSQKGKPQGVVSLLQWCLTHGEYGQQLMNEWTYRTADNKPSGMEAISYGSTTEVVWKCKKGHTWKAVIGARTHNRNGCPYCSALLVSSENSLQTWCLNNGEYGRQLINEWTGIDKNNKPISMNNVTRASSRKVKWKCSKGHVWAAAVCSRTSNKTGCPYCFKDASDENNLKVWCLSKGLFGHQLLEEWTGLDENNKTIHADNIAYSSKKKVKWECNQGHIWTSTVANRTIHKTGCPYCSGRKTSNMNSLKTWCNKNGEWGQHLIREWTGLDENNQPISMDSVSYGTKKKVKWKCSQGHEWIASIRNRTTGKSGCPYCSGRGRNKH